ncbi:MAG: hypothetical protein JW860_09615 [Sedimentisphaerales bacterium]|nr:hypothetical protein [Sedimentisphaerales bacterium]
MAVEATASKFTRNTRIYLAVMCLAFGLYFFYDGWFGEYRQKELDKNDGKPSPNLLFNQYAIIPLGAIALWAIISLIGHSRKKIVADDKKLILSGNYEIPYSALKKINKTEFKKSGYIIIEYEENSEIKTLKLSDRTYDNLGSLLDEIIRQTGAAPPEETDDKNS